jgi:hypothetical protein
LQLLSKNAISSLLSGMAVVVNIEHLKGVAVVSSGFTVSSLLTTKVHSHSYFQKSNTNVHVSMVVWDWTRQLNSGKLYFCKQMTLNTILNSPIMHIKQYRIYLRIGREILDHFGQWFLVRRIRGDKIWRTLLLYCIWGRRNLFNS